MLPIGISDINEYSISIPVKCLNNACALGIDATDEDACAFNRLDNATAHQQEQEKSEFLFLCEKAHDIYTQETRHYQRITTGGSHQCDSGCQLMNLKFDTFSLGSSHPDRVHVCLGHATCKAPDIFHLHHLQIYDRVLFICTATNVVHICTESTCNAMKVDTGTFMCCPLTGNVHSNSQTVLSHGWIEDEWRKGVDFKMKETHDMPPEDNETHMGDKQRLDTNQHLSKLLQIQYSDTSDTKEAIEPILIKSIGHTIAQLMPGSKERCLCEAQTQLNVAFRLYDSVERYIKLSKSSAKQICIPHIYSIFRRVSEENVSQPATPSIHMDKQDIDTLSTAYAKSTLDYIHVLSWHSDFNPLEYNLRDLTCTILYLQRNNFIINGTNLIVADPVLLMLPNASQLHKFGYDRNMSTRIKNNIQYCVIDAIDQGTSISTFVLEMISVTDAMSYHDNVDTTNT